MKDKLRGESPIGLLPIYYFFPLLWFLFLFLSRVQGYLEGGGFSPAVYAGSAVSSGLLILILLRPTRKFAHRCKSIALAGGVLLFLLFDPRKPLGFQSLGNLPFLWFCILGALIFWVLYVLHSIFVKPYQCICPAPRDHEGYKRASRRGFTLAFLTLFLMAILELAARTTPYAWKWGGMLLNSDLRKYVRADETHLRINPLVDQSLYPRDPRLPRHMGKPDYYRVIQYDPVTAEVLGLTEKERILSTNRLGFYAPQPILPKPDGEIRIFCVGGSTTAQGGPKYSYPVYTENYLKKKGILKARAYVAATYSYASRDNLLRFREYLSYDPDLIIVYEGINELVNISLKPHPERNFWGSRFLGTVRDLLADEDERWNRVLQDIRKESIRNLELMILDAQKAKVKILFVGFVIPDFQSLPWNDYFYIAGQIGYRLRACYSTGSLTKFINLLNSEIRTLCQKYEVPYLDAPAHFQKKGLEFFYDPFHRRQTANEEWGEWIGQELLKTAQGKSPKGLRD